MDYPVSAFFLYGLGRPASGLPDRQWQVLPALKLALDRGLALLHEPVEFLKVGKSKTRLAHK